jgi:hypothetical protein
LRVCQFRHARSLVTIYRFLRGNLQPISVDGTLACSERHGHNEFLHHLKLQQLCLKVDLRTNPATKSLAEDRSLERNAGVLEALDRLSLYFCINFLQEGTIDSVPSRCRSLEIASAWRKWRISGALSIPEEPAIDKHPCPTGAETPYADNADFQRTLALAPYFAVNFTVHATDEIDQTRSAVA